VCHVERAFQGLTLSREASEGVIVSRPSSHSVLELLLSHSELIPSLLELLLSSPEPIAHSVLLSLAYRYPHSYIMTRPVTIDPRKPSWANRLRTIPRLASWIRKSHLPEPPGAHSCNPTTHVKPRRNNKPLLAHQITTSPAGSHTPRTPMGPIPSLSPGE
jgi:hypothetical protein